MDSLSSFHTPQSTYTTSWFSLFSYGKNCLSMENILHFFYGKSWFGLSKWKPLEFNVVLGSMLKILEMLDLATKRRSVGWNNWENTEVLPIFTILTTFQLGIGKALFLWYLSQLWLLLVLVAESEGIASLYLVNSGSWMHAVCKRKFKFQVFAL